MDDFNTMISNIGLTNSGFLGSKYTWSNNRFGKTRILERLDKSLLNALWLSSFTIEVTHLHRTCSDHSPLLLNFGLVNCTSFSFRFINAWAKHNQFLDIVKEVYETNVPGRPLQIFAMKLKLLKKVKLLEQGYIWEHPSSS